MAKSFRFEWNKKAFREARTLPEVRRELERIGKAIANDAGDGFKAESEITGGRGRARTAVFPTTAEAARKNRKDNTLIRALGRHS